MEEPHGLYLAPPAAAIAGYRPQSERGVVVVTADEREQHMRRMLEHGEKVQEKFRRDNAEFEESCRKFWDFMRHASLIDSNS